MNITGPVSFAEVINYSTTFVGMERFDFFPDNLDDIFLNDHEEIKQISRAEWRQNLEMPAYYIRRDFSLDVLDYFDVKVCRDSEADMYNRAMFPIYNHTWEYVVGIVGRAIVDDIPRWKNQTEFHKSEYLYAYWSALPHICKSGQIVLAEGQGDIMRLWEAGIYNAVGIFGSELSESQELLLQSTGAMNIITLFDNDEAGEKCRTSCDKKLRRLFNIRHVVPVGHDVGYMKPNQIKELGLAI